MTTARGDLIYSHSLKALQKNNRYLDTQSCRWWWILAQNRLLSWSLGSMAWVKPPPSVNLPNVCKAEGKSVMLAAGDTFRAAARGNCKFGERNNILFVAQGRVQTVPR